MVRTEYLFDLEQWEVKVYGEHLKDDQRIGLYDTYEEGKEAEKEWIQKNLH